MRFPDLFIIGAAKAKPTTLVEYLRRHPKLFISDPKEPEFFARDYLFETAEQLCGPLADVPLAETGRPPSLLDPESPKQPRTTTFMRYVRNVLNLLMRRTDFWSTVEGSWVSWSLLQQYSPDWRTLRIRVNSQETPEPLEQLCRQSARALLAAYQPQLGAMGNLILMQMAVLMQSRQRQQGCANILDSRDKRDLRAA